MNINSIKYGHPNAHAITDIKRFLKFGLDVESVVRLLKNAPKNSSRQTHEELRYLWELQEEERPYMERLVRSVDEDLIGVFLDMCAEWQLGTYEEEIREVGQMWGSIACVLKIWHNRARPFQLAPHHGIPLYPMSSISAWSASYPSGHTIQAEAIAKFYGEKYPEIAEEFDRVAKAISHTRMVGGFHYPSDIKASEELVESLWGRL